MPIKKIILLAIIFATFIFLCWLGFWQLQRLEWKQNLLAQIEQNKNAPTISLAELVAKQKAGIDIEYRPVKTTGTFMHAQEQHYLATHMGQVGYYIFTPLKTGENIIFINRGFVPSEKKQLSTRMEYVEWGEVNVEGYARKAPTKKPNFFTPENDIKNNIYYWRSLESMAKATSGVDSNGSVKVLPFFIDSKAGNNNRLPIGGTTRFNLPNSHLQYAITWFSLAISLLAVGGLFLYRLA